MQEGEGSAEAMFKVLSHEATWNVGALKKTTTHIFKDAMGAKGCCHLFFFSKFLYGMKLRMGRHLCFMLWIDMYLIDIRIHVYIYIYIMSSIVYIHITSKRLCSLHGVTVIDVRGVKTITCAIHSGGCTRIQTIHL